MEEIDQRSSFDGHFFGYGNDPVVMLVYTDSVLSHKIRQVHHNIVNVYSLSAFQNDRLLPHAHLIRIAHAERYGSSVTKPEEWKLNSKLMT